MPLRVLGQFGLPHSTVAKCQVSASQRNQEEVVSHFMTYLQKSNNFTSTVITRPSRFKGGIIDTILNGKSIKSHSKKEKSCGMGNIIAVIF